MIILPLTALVLSATISATPASAARVDMRAVPDSEPLLTADALTGMTTFWTAFLKEPDSIKTAGRKANQKPLRLTIAGAQTTLPSVVDIATMASTYPAAGSAFLSSVQAGHGREPLSESSDRSRLGAIDRRSHTTRRSPAGWPVFYLTVTLNGHPASLLLDTGTGGNALLLFPEPLAKIGVVFPTTETVVIDSLTTGTLTEWHVKGVLIPNYVFGCRGTHP